MTPRTRRLARIEQAKETLWRRLDRCQDPKCTIELENERLLNYLVRLARRTGQLEQQLAEAHQALKVIGAKGYLMPVKRVRKARGG